MLHLRNNLARHEVRVAGYYMRRGAFLAAANRAEYVVQNYQRTPALREALELMVAAYTELGMDDLATDTQRVLALNENSGALIDDPQEKKDVHADHPDIVAKLERLADQTRADLGEYQERGPGCRPVGVFENPTPRLLKP